MGLVNGTRPILVFEKYPLLAGAVVALLGRRIPDHPVSNALDRDSLESSVRTANPILVLVDADAGRSAGHELIRSLLAVPDAPRVIPIENQIYAQTLAQYREIGVSGIVSRYDSAAIWLKVVQLVLAGRPGFSHVSIRRVRVPPNEMEIDPDTVFQSLSQRERQVLYHLWLGNSLRDTAAKLDLPFKSVDYHSCNLRRKLKVKSRVALVHLASRFEKQMLEQAATTVKAPAKG